MLSILDPVSPFFSYEYSGGEEAFGVISFFVVAIFTVYWTWKNLD